MQPYIPADIKVFHFEIISVIRKWLYSRPGPLPPTVIAALHVVATAASWEVSMPDVQDLQQLLGSNQEHFTPTADSEKLLAYFSKICAPYEDKMKCINATRKKWGLSGSSLPSVDNEMRATDQTIAATQLVNLQTSVPLARKDPAEVGPSVLPLAFPFLEPQKQSSLPLVQHNPLVRSDSTQSSQSMNFADALNEGLANDPCTENVNLDWSQYGAAGPGGVGPPSPLYKPPRAFEPPFPTQAMKRPKYEHTPTPSQPKAEPTLLPPHAEPGHPGDSHVPPAYQQQQGSAYRQQP
jgi:hypothetical protein